MAVQDIDRGFFRIRKQLKIFKDLEVLVGFQGIHGEMALIATYHEFGTENMPARPFLRSAFEVAQDQVAKRIEKALNSILKGTKTAVQAASLLGLFGVNLVKKRIRDSPSWAEELSALTIALKGSTKPLIDTAQMLNSVTYVVEHNGTQVANG
jgi:hypothetical protein